MDGRSQGEGAFLSGLFHKSNLGIFVNDPSLIPYTSVAAGLFACKMIYDITHLASTSYIKSYSSLPRIKKIDWNDRGVSTIHAIYITTAALYFTFWSDVFLSEQLPVPASLRSSSLSTFGLGVFIITYCFELGLMMNPAMFYDFCKFLQILFTVLVVCAGYFISDLAMILWFYPFLGGMEYVVHHLLSLAGVMYSMLTGEGQIYAYMNLISEATTPGINLRWYFDSAGMKDSTAYLINGVGMFISWVVARIMLFIFIFFNIYRNYDQVKQMQALGMLLAIGAPSVFFILNVMWFGKIVKGLKKTLARKRD